MPTNRDLNIRLERAVVRAPGEPCSGRRRPACRWRRHARGDQRLKMDVLNAEQATNLLQVAEGSLNEMKRHAYPHARAGGPIGVQHGQ